jgi:hypothetical protein
LLLGGGAAVVLVAAAIVFAVVSGGDDDAAADPGVGGTPGIRTPSTGGTRGGPSPVLTGPASRFAASAEDIGGGVQGVPPESYDLTPDTYSSPELGPFRNIDEGRAKVSEWGYSEGYVSVLEPDGLLAGVVEGRFYVRVEAHLFQTPQGAAAAFSWYNEVYAGIDTLSEEDASRSQTTLRPGNPSREDREHRP